MTSDAETEGSARGARRWGAWAAAALALASALATGRTAAAAEPPSVVVWVEGKGSEGAQREVRKALAEASVVHESRALSAVLAREGQRAPLGATLSDDKRRAAFAARVSRAAREAHVDDVVVVFVSDKGGRGRALLLAVDAQKGTPRFADVSYRRGDGAVGAAARAELSKLEPPEAAPPPPPREAEPPAEPSPASLGASDRDVAERLPRTARERGHELFLAALGAEAGGRRFRYSDAVSPSLRRYDLGAAPLASVTAGLYPLADVARVVDAGVIGGYAQAVALSSAARSGGPVGTSWSRFFAGVRGRAHPLAGVEVGVSAAYAGETFGFDGAPPELQLPDVAYRGARVGADAEIALGRFGVGASAAYLAVSSAGPLADRFTQASVGGVELGGAVSYAVTPSWRAGAQLSYRRFSYSMSAAPGDALVAGGAVDELYGLSGAVAYAF